MCTPFHRLLFTFAAGLCLLLCGCNERDTAMAAEFEPNRSNTLAPFAIVELYTSEGCSSCPPADAVLSDLLREARGKGTRIFPLSFHVDYWDRLGWKDPFSSESFSLRQRAYGRAMNLRSIYTPQMIVNGKVEFVGSDRGKARQAIADALAQPAKAQLLLNIKRADAKTLSITCDVPDAPAGSVVQIALVERGLITEVPRGENAGRKLTHDNVVRLFQTHEPKNGRVEARIPLPPGLNPENASVIAYLQEKTLRILAADGHDL